MSHKSELVFQWNISQHGCAQGWLPRELWKRWSSLCTLNTWHKPTLLHSPTPPESSGGSGAREALPAAPAFQGGISGSAEPRLREPPAVQGSALPSQSPLPQGQNPQLHKALKAAALPGVTAWLNQCHGGEPVILAPSVLNSYYSPGRGTQLSKHSTMGGFLAMLCSGMNSVSASKARLHQFSPSHSSRHTNALTAVPVSHQQHTNAGSKNDF